MKGEQPGYSSVPGIDDEAAEEPDDEPVPTLSIEDLVPIPATETSRLNIPPPPTAVVSAPASVIPETPIASTGSFVQPETPLDIEQAGPPVPSLGLPGPITPGMEVDAGEIFDSADAVEPDSKRPRLSTMRIGSETYVHVDVDSDEYFQQLEEQTEEYPMELVGDDILHDAWDYEDSERELNESDLWQPFSALEPVLDATVMEKIDAYADQVEIERLLAMGVITTKDGFSDELGSQLSAKFVRAWRKKTRKVPNATGNGTTEVQGWLRRSRLVAREYNWLDVREDVYSPSSNSAVVKLLPALTLSDGFRQNCILGTLDIGDAFLQVNQPMPRVVKLGKQDFIILRCLPGQRDASKLWYNHFVQTLKDKFNAEVCIEQPCVLKVTDKAAMVLHVDDVLFMGDEQWIRGTFLPELEKTFRLSSIVISRQTGGSFEFLKRYHVVEPGYEHVTVYPEAKHVCTMFEKYTKANGKAPKLAKTPCSPSSPPSDAKMDEPLSDQMAEQYRSLVGIAMYVSQERFDLQFATKTLASSLKTPTVKAWQELGRLVGYMKYSETFALRMKKTQKGSSFLESHRNAYNHCDENCIETFSDSDWSGRSTSSAVHTLNGLVVWSTSRSQKCVSLSSTEAEWYAATSGACDGLYLHHVISFLCNGKVKPLILHTDNSAVRMLSKKLGAGRLRHIRGRLLWLQEKVAAEEMVIKQVSTNYNIADCNTKALNKERFMTLMFLLGFVNNDEPVGETEFSRMEAKQMLKDQVRMIRETVDGKTQHVSCAKSTKFAKQFLRVLSIWSAVELADGKMLSALVPTTIEALSSWHGISSPMLLALVFGFLLVTIAVAFMFPAGSNEPDPEQPEDPERGETSGEPSEEPQPSRYPMDVRSLGYKFPSVFSDVMFRCEGLLIWMCHRCEERIRRDNKPLLNTVRKDELKTMTRMCMDGKTYDQSQNLKESLLAITDLSDDETSPRFNMTEERVKTDIAQAFQAYQVGMNLFGHLLQPQRRAGSDGNSEASEEEIEEQRHQRYLHSSMSEVSDPAEWMEIHHQDNMSEDHETDEQRERRYMTSTRSEVSDVDRWETMMGVYMGEAEENEEESQQSDEIG